MLKFMKRFLRIAFQPSTFAFQPLAFSLQPFYAIRARHHAQGQGAVQKGRRTKAKC